jgi:hypothetical protein
VIRRAFALALFVAAGAQAATKGAIVGPERLLPSAVRRQSLEMAAGRSTILVVWRELIVSIIGEHVIGTLVQLDGQQLGAPIDILRGNHPRLSFDGSRFLVLGSQGATLLAQFVDESGTLTGTPFTISDHQLTFTDSGFLQTVPGAAARTIVAWPESSGLRAGAISGSGLTSNVAAGEAGEVVTGGADARTVAVAVTPSGQTLIARVSQIGDQHGVFATIADAALTKTAAVTVESESAGGTTIVTGAEDDLDAATSGDAFAVVWSTGAPRTVSFARVAPDGAVTAKQVLAPAGASPRVVWTGSEFIVVWRHPDGGVFGAALDANGHAVADPFLIAPAPAGAAGLQALAPVPGGAVVAYGYLGGTAAVRTISIVPLRHRAARR